MPLLSEWSGSEKFHTIAFRDADLDGEAGFCGGAFATFQKLVDTFARLAKCPGHLQIVVRQGENLILARTFINGLRPRRSRL
jgi:hypothetical protein